MPTIIRTNSENKDFQKLVIQLDAYLAEKNGDSNTFFTQFNTLKNINHVVIALNKNAAIGCGAIKEYDQNTMEIKRMYVTNEMRGNGVAVAILAELEAWAKELGFQKCILETGNEMQAAINLYQKCGYQIISNYGQYINVTTSICFEKAI